jgi:hypothetical protein
MVTVIFMQSVMEIALPVKKLSSKNWSNLCLKTGEQVKLEVNSKKNLTIEKLYWE